MRFILLILFICMTPGMVSSQSGIDTKDPLWLKADELAHRFILLDGHVDLPYRMGVKNFRPTKELLGIPISSDKGDFDYERARIGGLNVPFMAVYVPAEFQKEGGGKAFADQTIDMIESIMAAHPDKFAKAPTVQSVRDNFAKGLMSLPMGMENGAGIEDDLTNLLHFHQRGIRYITLTHSKDNLICDSSYDDAHTWNGLSPFGEKVVAEMNRIGIMVDISHVSDSTFYDVLKISTAPVIASHSSCRTFTPGWERNMNDEMIKALAQHNGVIQINFGSMFLDRTVDKANRENRKKLEALLEKKGLTMQDAKAKGDIDTFQKKSPTLFSDVEMVAKHVDHVVQLVGIDHVGIGSDFDGVGDNLPTGLKDVSQYPNLIYLLLKKGYSEQDIEKICSGNVLRVWSEVERIATQ
ncbi:MAG: dipeptidase [Saprospiraceae bacterium]|nr:dipeptidase [Saprospiraceae bacterium]